MVSYDQGNWTAASLPTDHSTFVELQAVRAAIERTSLRDRLVRVLTDNTITVAQITSMYSPVDYARAELL